MYTSFPSADSVIVRDLFGVEDVPEGSTLIASAECTPRVHPCMKWLWKSKFAKNANRNCLLTAMAINSSKSKTGLLTVLQQDQDLRPSWNTYHLRWSGEEVTIQETLPEHQGGVYKVPLYYLQHRTLFHTPCAYNEALLSPKRDR